MATFDSAHPIPDSVRNGPLGFNVLLREMRSLKTSMYLLMDHLAQVRAENRTLSSEVQELRKSRDYNFEDIRSELIHFKKSLGCESLEHEVAPTDATVTPDSEQLPLNSDMVDVITIMGNGSAEPPKREIIQVGPDVRVKQEEGEEALDQEPMITDGLTLEPVASTSAEQYNGSSAVKSHTRQYVNRSTTPVVAVVRVSNEKRTIPWMESEEYETWANDLKRRKMDSLSRGLPKHQNLTRFTYCYICRTTILSSKCVVPTNPQKFDIFLHCAAKTMTLAAIDSFKERNANTKVLNVCESHVPGYKTAIKEIPNPNQFPGIGDEICEDAEEKTIVQQRRDNFVKSAPRLITKFPVDNKKGASK